MKRVMPLARRPLRTKSESRPVRCCPTTSAAAPSRPRSLVETPNDLAQALGHRARQLRRLVHEQLADEPDRGRLRDLFNAFKLDLAQDQQPAEFADAFAQTITYGLLALRGTATNSSPHTRQNAVRQLSSADCLPTDLLASVLGTGRARRSSRLHRFIDDIVEYLDGVDVSRVFGAGTTTSGIAVDPIVGFYEPFLRAYDKELKHKRGVFFTPRPVVSYLVRRVHELLKTQYGLEDGLASRDTWGDVAKRIDGLAVPEGVTENDPFVCILDPATGTGTFLSECIDVIERTMKKRWCREFGADAFSDVRVVESWNHYVPKYLLPRLYGYELMMAAYAVARLKLLLKLKETDYRLRDSDRLHVYLTNSLEDPNRASNPELAKRSASLSTYAEQVDAVKFSRRYTVILGNPPYAGHSSNRGPWARTLVERYRSIGPRELRLAQGKWLQNDYVKFIALAETILMQSHVGAFGFVTDHGYLDGDTYPGLRHRLLTCFSGLEILDLHGSLTRGRTAPSGEADENVFDIQQGVAVTVAWRTSAAHALGRVSMAELWGTRCAKLAALRAAEQGSPALTWRDVRSFDERFLFVAGSEPAAQPGEYAGFDRIDAIFSENGKPAPGFLTTHDRFAIAFTEAKMKVNVETLARTRNEKQARATFKLCGQAQWQYATARAVLRRSRWHEQIRSCLYRPFDRRWTVYDPAVLVHRRERVSSHLLAPGNLALLTTRMTKGDDFGHVFVTDRIAEVICLSSKTSVNAFVFPLYLRDEAASHAGNDAPRFRSNINPRIFDAYRALVGDAATPRAIFDYCYALLFSQAYRKRYNPYLIREFPRVPRPSTGELFNELVVCGATLVKAHLLECAPMQSRLCGSGDNVVAPRMPKFDPERQRLSINSSQYLEGVGARVWEFRIGSHWVCKQWLSARRGLVLSADDCVRFSSIVEAIEVTLAERDKVDAVISRHGGWPGAFVVKSSSVR
jgi:predicted helicase